MSLRKNQWLLIFIASLICQYANGDQYSQVGSFGSESKVVSYNSNVPHSPGSYIFPILTNISGLSKFDPDLGTLTDITLSIGDLDPIYYDMVGSLTVRRVTFSPDGFSGTISSLQANVGIFYEASDNSLVPLLTDSTSFLSSGCSGSEGSSCGLDPIYPDDFFLTGNLSVLSQIESADFVGDGVVDSLFFGVQIQETAEFTLSNATMTMAIYIDTFGSDSSLDLNYAFSPVPIPPAIVMFLPSAILVFRRKRFS